jgi:hypothetical protein
MKKMIFLMLLSFLGITASMNAQVLIGGNNTDDPHSGAILDLRSTTQGLLLPNVVLDDELTEFVLPEQPPKFTKTNAKGMFVYNTNPNVGVGVYVWDGSQWGLVKESVGNNPITGITVSAAGDATSVIRGNTLQLSVILTPTDASNPHVAWSLISGNGIAKVNASGIVTGLHVGKATIQATSSTGITGEIEIQVTNSGQTVSEYIGVNEYLTYNYDGTVWMVENIKEAPANGQGYKTTYNDDGTDISVNEGNAMAAGERGYYYLRTAATTICPAPWFLPDPASAQSLNQYLSTPVASDYEKEWWFSNNNRAGRFGGPWMEWDRASFTWINYNYLITVDNSSPYIGLIQGGGNQYFSVRCIRLE